jgi:hypothetical protein
METLINFLGIDLQTCEGRRLRQILGWIAGIFMMVIGLVFISVSTTLIKNYNLFISLMIAVFSTFILFHIYRMLIVFATTDRLLTPEEHAARAANAANQGEVPNRYTNVMTMCIKYIFLSVFAFAFGFFIYVAFAMFFSNLTSFNLFEEKKGVLELAINFIQTANFKNRIVFIGCVIFVLLPILLTDILLSKQYIRESYRTLNRRTLIVDDRFGWQLTQTQILNARNELREGQVNYYNAMSDNERPNIKSVMIYFINRTYSN